MSLTELAPNLYVGDGFELITVGALRTVDGWLLIDAPPMPHNAREWEKALRTIDRAPLIYGVLTGIHPHRLIGSGRFAVDGLTPIMQQGAAERIASLKDGSLHQAAAQIAGSRAEEARIAALTPARPELVFEGRMRLYCGDDVITLRHHPGDAPGRLWLAVENRQVIFVGDTVVLDRPPVIDTPDLAGWLAALDTLRRDYDGWTLVPGRGPVTIPAETAALSDYLNAAVDAVSDIHARNASRGEVAKLVDTFVARFDGLPEAIAPEVRAGLEAIYEILKTRRDA